MRGNPTRLLANQCSVRALTSALPPASRVSDRGFWTTSALVLVFSSLGVSEPALAQVCTPPPPTPDASGNAICTGAFTTSIDYNAIANQTLHVTLAPPVSVTLPVPGIAVNLNNFNNPGSPVLLSANGATINVTNPAAGEHRGLYVETVSANATITASGQIDVAGVQGAPRNKDVR